MFQTTNQIYIYSSTIIYRMVLKGRLSNSPFKILRSWATICLMWLPSSFFRLSRYNHALRRVLPKNKEGLLTTHKMQEGHIQAELCFG